MFVGPLMSIAVVLVHAGESLTAALAARWFVFWGVGLRLFIAGLRQMIQPRYTAQTVLGIQSDDALVAVRELGIANTAMGVMGSASLALTGWTLPGAVVGGVFYTLAGLNHLRQPHRNAIESVAMVSDLVFGALM